MNSINSIQSVYNKILSNSIPSGNNTTSSNQFVPPTITINNSDWSSPALSNGQAIVMESVTTITSSTTFTNLYSWDYDLVISAQLSSGTGINLILTNNVPGIVTELNTTHTQSLGLAFYLVQGSINVSQSISFTTVGTYSLVFYAAPFQGNYAPYNASYNPSVQTLSASIGGSTLSPFSLTANSAYTQFTLDFTITSTGNYTLSFLSANSDKSVNTALNLTAVSIIYLHA